MRSLAALTSASAQSERPVPPLRVVSDGGETAGSANLSDQLSRSKGVICPPAGIDPGISVHRSAAV